MKERVRHLSIPRNALFFLLCLDKNMYIIKDEFHDYYECPSYDDLRDLYFNVSWINNRTLDKYCTIHSERIQTKKRDSFNILILSQLQMSVLWCFSSLIVVYTHQLCCIMGRWHILRNKYLVSCIPWPCLPPLMNQVLFWL